MKLIYGLAFLICTLIWVSASFADSTSLSLAMPGSPDSYQSDRFRAGDLECSNAIGSATRMEMGVTGVINRGRYDQLNQYFNDIRTGDVGVYAKIIIPLGKVAKNRIDCNRLFEVELNRRTLEIQKLQEEINALRNMQFEE